MPTEEQLSRYIEVNIPNPNLDADAYDFESVTEFKDCPLKRECPEDGLLYSSDDTFWCQDGCDEVAFQFIVEPGDSIPMQFRLEDLINADPANPDLGWREDDEAYWLGVEIVALDGTVLWDGPTYEVASSYHVGVGPDGSLQNIVFDVNLILAQIPEDVTCWFFRINIGSFRPEYNVVDAESTPQGPVPVGYAYINFGDSRVYEWNGSQFVKIGPTLGEDSLWYVAETGRWYMWTGTVWVGLAGAPELEEPEFETVTTMSYRLRRCDEPVVEFAADDAGVDCLGFDHNPPQFEYNMDPIEGLIFVDYFTGGSGENPLAVVHDPAWDSMPVGTTMVSNGGGGTMGPAFARLWTKTEDTWSFVDLPEGTMVLIMNSGAPGAYGSGMHFNTDTNAYETITAGTVMSVVAYVPLIGPWYTEGPLADVFPGEVFDPTINIGVPFNFSFKVKGSLEYDELPTARLLTKNNRVISTTPQTRARVRTTGLPEGVARTLHSILGARSFTINGEVWHEFDDLRKNNDDGAHWWLDFGVTRDECERDMTC